MKILILVLSHTKHPFDLLLRTQIKTWDSVEVEGIDTVYYCGGLNEYPLEIENPSPNSVILQFDITDAYYLMAGKFKACLQACNLDQYDYIFRTNSSSYVNKPALVEFVKKLSKEKLYAGWEIEGNAGYNIVSGAGFFLTPDTAAILRDNIDPNFEREEDVYCGQILHEHGIKIIDDKSRYDTYTFQEYMPLKRYHYRFKTADRRVDAHNMIMLHNKILSQ